MSIKVTIPRIKAKIGIKQDITLEIRKTLGNQLVVFDHPDVDIVIYPESKKNTCSCQRRNKRRSV